MPKDRNPNKSAERDVQDNGTRREAQDRSDATPNSGGARSPVDTMHVDAPKHQKNKRGHLQDKMR